MDNDAQDANLFMAWFFQFLLQRQYECEWLHLKHWEFFSERIDFKFVLHLVHSAF